jgi:hypothetical protein
MSHPEVLIRAAAPHEIPEIEAVCAAAYLEYRSEMPLSVFNGMRAARRICEHVGFRRCAEFDLKASDIGLGENASGDVSIVAYRLDFPST